MQTPLAKNLYRLRRDAGLSQACLAERTRLSQTWISRLESGNANPTIETLESLAKALDITVLDLMRGPLASPRRTRFPSRQPADRRE